MANILVAEQNGKIRNMLCRALRKEGYTAEGASDGFQAQKALEKCWDLIVTADVLPGIGGFELMQRMQEAGRQIPVLMLLCREGLGGIRQNLLPGPEYCMAQPVDLPEFLRRIRLLLGRARCLSQGRLVLGETVLDESGCVVSREKTVLRLSPREFSLLFQMAASPGRIFTQKQLLDAAWGGTERKNGELEQTMQNLKLHLKENPDLRIISLRGIGYRIAS